MKINKNSTGIFKVVILLFGIAAIFSFGLNTISAANTSIYVSTHGNNSWDGLNPKWNGTSGPKATINNATGTVVKGGTVYIASGTYRENKITINKNMNIIGANQKNTIIYGTNTGSIFIIGSNVKVTIANLELLNGTTNNGGTIQNKGILTLKNSIFANNKANMGGAIYNIGTLTVSGCSFTGNHAVYGGAIYNDNSMTIVNSKFTKNSADNSGGSIYNYYTNNDKGILTLTSTAFTSNNAVYGGAICTMSHFGTLNVNGVTFTTNNATWGGAIYNGDILNVKSSTFNGNHANCGGALYNEGKAVFTFNQIIKNTAKTQGNAVFNDLGKSNLSLNWWGSNTNPIKSIYGTTVSSWLVLTIKSNPKTIKAKTGTSTVTADLLHNNHGTVIKGYVPNGIIMNFNTTKGKIIKQAKTVKGAVKTTFKSGSSRGTATITAKLDNQTVKTTIKIK